MRLRAENARLSSILEQAVPLAEKSTAEIDRLWDENARLKEALEKIANYLPMFDYVVNDDYGKPDISKPGSPFDRGRAQEAEHLSSIARATLQNEGERNE